MRVFVTGVTGQLGHDVVLELVKREHEAIGSGGRPQEQVDMRVFVTGVAGQLGHDCVIELEKRGHRSIGSDISPVPSYLPSRTKPLGVDTPDPSYVQLDITNEQLVKRTIEELKPDVIIHCAAWTAVDAAEALENKDKVETINHLGTQYIAEAAKTVDAKMVYISTDYVFDGQGERPWQPDDKTPPSSVHSS